MQEFNYNLLNNNIETNSKNNFNLNSIKTNQNENMKMFNSIKLNTPINGNNIANNNYNPTLKVFDSSKTFSTKNANGKKIVFNEKQDKTDMNNNLQLINQQNIINNNNKIYNLNQSNNLNEKSNNLNRFTKIGKEHTNNIGQKSTDKIKNLFANKFA